MSRLSDLLNPAPSSTTTTASAQETAVAGKAESRTKSHQRNQSITSPLEALAIAATTSSSEPGLINATNPVNFHSPSSQPLYYSNEGSYTTHSHPVLTPPKPVVAQPISYSLYNQPSPAYQFSGVSATANKDFGHTASVDTNDLSANIAHNKVAVAQDGVTHNQQVIATMPEAQVKREDSRADNDASFREQSINQSIETPNPEKERSETNKTPVTIIKEEAQTPKAATKSPAAAPSPPVAKTMTSKNGIALKPEKKKIPKNNSKKPAAKKRKLAPDSRDETPALQRSGTPNSIKRQAQTSKLVKQNSTTPSQASTPPPAQEEAGEDEEDEESDSELFCICRKPDDHTWMIGCDGGCEDWFHGRCVEMDQKDENLIDKYICEVLGHFLKDDWLISNRPKLFVKKRHRNNLEAYVQVSGLQKPRPVGRVKSIKILL